MFTNLLSGSCQFYNPGNVFLRDLGNISLKCNSEGVNTPISQSLWDPNFLDGWQLANTDGWPSQREKKNLQTQE